MKDETRIILNALLAQARRLSSMAVAFLMVPYLIGHLGEESYGVIGIAASILGFLTLIEMGIRPATVRQYTSFVFGDEPDRANALVSTSMVFYLGLALTIMTSLAVFGRSFLSAMQIPAEILPVAWWTLLAVGLALCVNLIGTPYRAALVSHLRHDIEHYTEMLTTLLRAGVIVAIFTFWTKSLLVWGAATLLSAAVVFLVVRHRSVGVSPTLQVRLGLASREGWSDLSKVGVDTTMAQFSSWLNMQSGPILVSFFLGAAAVTHYAPVLVLMNALMSFSLSFIRQLIPVMTRAAGRQDFLLMQRTLVRSARYSILISGTAACWVAVHAQLIVPTWLGDGFEDTALVLVYWCGAVALRTYTGASFPVFLGANRLRGVAIFNLFLAAASLGLAVYLVGYRDLGVVGAAIPAFAAQAIRTFVRVWLASRVCKISPLLFGWRSYPGPTLCLVATVGIALAMQHHLDLALWPQLLASGGASLLGFALCAWTLGLTSQDRTKLAAYLRTGLSRFV